MTVSDAERVKVVSESLIFCTLFQFPAVIKNSVYFFYQSVFKK